MTYRKSLQSTAEMAAWYDQKYQEMNGCWKTPESELDQHLNDFGIGEGAPFEDALRILDVGCGDGSFVRHMRLRGHFAHGIEVSEKALASADPLIRDNLSIHDICDGPVKSFDRIISLGSLEHVIDIDAALENIFLSLAAEGRFYFFIPNEFWKHNDQPNERTATDAEWTALFCRHGLIVESAKRWNDSTAFQGRLYKKLSVDIATVICGGDGPVLPGISRWEPEPGANKSALSPELVSLIGYDNRANLVTPCQAYQALLEETESDILVYVHDDVEIYDPNWLSRIMKVFESNPACVAVGLGGARSLGTSNLYKRPYRLEDMQRLGYASNQRDAEMHGERLTGDRRVAVLDAFFMAIRTEWLYDRLTVCPQWKHMEHKMRGGMSDIGWPVSWLTHHCLDLWLACEAARSQQEIWMCGIDCMHFGGGSSHKVIYHTCQWLQGGSVEEDHLRPHRFLYEEFRDCLPIQI